MKNSILLGKAMLASFYLLGSSVMASSVAPISLGKMKIFVPQPKVGVDGLRQIMSENGDVDVVLTNVTPNDHIYYRRSTLEQGVWQDKSWQCQAASGLPDGLLSFTQEPAGLHRYDISTCMMQSSCNATQFDASIAACSTPQATDSVLVLDHSVQPTLANQGNELHFIWPAVEGAEEYKVEVYKNGQWQPLSQLNSAIGTITHASYQAQINQQGYFDAGDLGNGYFDFRVSTCIRDNCSTPVATEQQVAVKPQKMLFNADGFDAPGHWRGYSNSGEPGRLIVDWIPLEDEVTEYRITQYRIPLNGSDNNPETTVFHVSRDNVSSLAAGNLEMLSFDSYVPDENARYGFDVQACYGAGESALCGDIDGYGLHTALYSTYYNSGLIIQGEVKPYVLDSDQLEYSYSFSGSTHSRSVSLRHADTGSILYTNSGLSNGNSAIFPTLQAFLQGALGESQVFPVNLELHAQAYVGATRHTQRIGRVHIERFENPDMSAVADEFTVPKNRSTLLPVVANDHTDSDPLTIDIVTRPSVGTVEVEDFMVKYTPPQDYQQTDTFTYRLVDKPAGQLHASKTSNIVTVKLNVQGDNVLPSANDDSAVASVIVGTPALQQNKQYSAPAAGSQSTQNEGLPTIVIDVLANDYDEDVADQLLLVDEPLRARLGTAIVRDDRKAILYTPANEQVTTDSFYYRVTDGKGGVSLARVTVDINVSINKPSAPVVVTDNAGNSVLAWDLSPLAHSYKLQIKKSSQSWPKDAQHVIDGATNTFDLSGLQPGHYQLRMVSCYTAQICGATYSDSVAFTQVGAVVSNDVAQAPYEQPVTIDVLNNDELIGQETFEVILASNAADGTATINSDNTITYTPKAGFYGNDQFSYYVAWAGQQSATADVSIDVAAPIEVRIFAKGGSVPDATVSAPSVPDSDFFGAVPGSASVNGGEANYSIAVAIPPGRKGMQPDISLNYGSRGGNSIAGVGWSVSAGGAISRCAPTLAQDGYKGGIAFDVAKDRLCLNGQRLISVSGTYGYANTTYRTELDNLVVVTQKSGSINDGSSYFEVNRPNGVVVTYGRHDAHRVNLLDESTSENTTDTKPTLSWLINEEKDPAGNTITYQYVDKGDAEILLENIYYTGFGSTQGDRQVNFTYEDRVLKSTSYLSGGKSRTTQRLKSVNTRYNGSLVRSYILDYKVSPATQRSLLTSVTVCGHDGDEKQCHAPTTFDWSDNKTVYQTELLADSAGLPLYPNWQLPVDSVAEEQQYSINVMPLKKAVPRGDVNGDGVRDYQNYVRPTADTIEYNTFFLNAEGDKQSANVSLSNCNWNDFRSRFTCFEADFNLDGKTDSWSINPYTDEVLLYYTQGDLTPGSEVKTGVKLISNIPAKNGEVFGITDMNGDGWPDLLMLQVEGDEQHPFVYVYPHTGNTSTPYGSGTLLFEIRYSHFRGVTGPVQLVGDMDGNGLPDFTVSEKMSHEAKNQAVPILDRMYLTYVENGVIKVRSQSIRFAGEGNEGEYTRLMDVNGDGLADWVGWLNANKTDVQMHLKLNQGDGSFSAPIPLGEASILPHRFIPWILKGQEFAESRIVPKYGNAFKMMDVNGDGRMEMIMPGERIIEACKHYPHKANSFKCGDDIYTQRDVNGNIVAPATSDDYSIYQYDAMFFDENADGTFTARLETTDMIGAADHAYVVDSLGKGLPDLVFTYGCHTSQLCRFADTSEGTPLDGKELFNIYYNRNYGSAEATTLDKTAYRQRDVLKKVNNGVGVFSHWQYLPLTSGQVPGFYDADLANVLDDEHFTFTPSTYAVSRFDQSNGVSGSSGTRYQYKGATWNSKGRGFRGFNGITEFKEVKLNEGEDNERQVDIITESDYLVKFPYSRKLLKRNKRVSDHSVPFELTSNDWQRNTVHQSTFGKEVEVRQGVNEERGAYLLYNAKKRHVVCDLAASVCDWDNYLSREELVLDQTNIDKYGNVLSATSMSEDAYGVYKQLISTLYDATDAWPHKLTQTTTTALPIERKSAGLEIDAATDISTSVKTVYAWNTAYRKPEKITNYADGVLTTTADTIYTAHGLPEVVTVTGDSRGIEQLRRSTTHYSTDGYFATKTSSRATESISIDSATITTDPKTGSATSSVTPYGITTTNHYDVLGRLTKVEQTGAATQYLRYLASASYDPILAKAKILTYQAGSPIQVAHIDMFGRDIFTSVQGFGGSLINTQTKFNRNGEVTHTSMPFKSGEEPSFTTYHDFDALGRPGKKVVPQITGSRTTEYTYNGFKTDILVNSALSLSRTYNMHNQLMETVDANGGRSLFAYNALGNPIRIRDAAGNDIDSMFDASGRQTWVNDPNQGRTSYVYNDFGDITQQTDADGNVTDIIVDYLGRIYLRNAAGEQASFIWDTEKKGMLSSSSANGVTRSFTYDDHLRILDTTTEIGSDSYVTRVAYDANLGRIKSTTYPNGLVVGYGFDDKGYVTSEYNAASGYVYRKLTAMDAMGHVTGSQLADTGNGSSFYLTATNTHDLKTGQMLSTKAVNTNGAAVHHIAYTNYDVYGNIKTQENKVLNAIDTFVYDNLHRLTQSTISSTTSATINYGYDAVGNLTYKDDHSLNQPGAYRYVPGTNQIEAIDLLDGTTDDFTYDKRGNQTHRNGQSEVIYNTFNKPTNINKHGMNLSFTYGADIMRYKQVRTINDVDTTTHYVDKLYEVEIKGDHRTTKAYLGDSVMLSEGTQVDDTFIRFTLRDRLGSGVTFTDEKGQVTAYRHFDPFGKPRSGDWSELPREHEQQLSQNPLDMDMSTRRGFTDHEHLDEVEIIHMNGRVYDYNVGRFMSVDPYIQSPSNTQSVNPYSYIMNNPLAGTDPTGYTSKTPLELIDEEKGKHDFISEKLSRRSKTKSGGDAKKEDQKGSDNFSPTDSNKQVDSDSKKLASDKDTTTRHGSNKPPSGQVIDQKDQIKSKSSKPISDKIKTATKKVKEVIKEEIIETIPTSKRALKTLPISLVVNEATKILQVGLETRKIRADPFALMTSFNAGDEDDVLYDRDGKMRPSYRINKARNLNNELMEKLKEYEANVNDANRLMRCIHGGGFMTSSGICK